MIQVRPVDVNKLKGVEFICECGQIGWIGFDEEGLSCDVTSPDMTLRIMIKSDAEDSPERFDIVEVLK